MSEAPVNSIGASPPVDASGSSQAIELFTPKLKIKKKKLATRKELDKK